MIANPFLGVVLHWLGGLASGSFYVPYKAVRKWSWETYWLVGGFFSWIIAPWILATLLTSDVVGVLSRASGSTLWWAYFFGAMWGLGGLTFGLTMRYLGMSLGMGVALGYCAAFGTLVPPIFNGEFGSIINTIPGKVTLAGVVVCLAGIGVAALAGLTKERQMPEEEKKKTIKEFNFTKGMLVATFSGIMSACFAFGLQAGKPIEGLTYRSDLIHAAQKDGKKVSDVAELDADAADKLVKSAKEKGFFKDADEEVRNKPTFVALIDELEAPLMTQVALADLKEQAARATGDQAEAIRKDIVKTTAKAQAVAKSNPAQVAILQSITDPVSARVSAYVAGMAKLQGKNPELKIVQGLKDFPRKEVAVATVNAGGNLQAYHSKHQLWTGLPVLCVVLLGGFTTNFIWCVYLNIANKSGYQYFSSKMKPEHLGTPAPSGGGHGGGAGGTQTAVLQLSEADLKAPMLNNYFFSALAGTTWYFQFFFYTMGSTQMGRYDFASWTLHMASIIIFSTMWGWILHEWKGASKKAHALIAGGILTLILSTIVIGYGTYLKGAGGGH